MEISSCLASLQLLSLRAVAATILYGTVWTTWSWVQFCLKLNWASQTIVSIWWSETHHLTGTHFTVASDWVRLIDKTYTWWQDQIWCFVQWPYQQWTLVWPMLHVSWSYGCFENWRMFTADGILGQQLMWIYLCLKLHFSTCAILFFKIDDDDDNNIKCKQYLLYL